MVETSVGAAFLAKQGHMVTYSDEVYNVWLDIIKGLEEGTIEEGSQIQRILGV